MKRWPLVAAIGVLGATVGLFASTLAIRIGRGILAPGDVIEVVPSIGAGAVGALLVWKRPGNVVGWILGALGLVGALVEVFEGLLAPPYSGAELVLALVDGRIFLANFALIAALFHAFPTGRAASPFWRKVGRVALVAFALVAVTFVFQPGPVDNEQPLGPGNPTNPIGVTGTAGTVLGAVGTAATPVFLLAGLVGGIASLIARFRRGTPIERLQIRWLATWAAVFGALLLAQVPLRDRGPIPIEVMDGALSVASIALPVAVGIAVLRYRLYDIGRIVNRTVSYSVLSALLGGVYTALVFGFGAVLPRSSDLTVAASTLAVAALFGPARRRVQVLVDRRFNRARYDAHLTIEDFSARLRDEIDLDALGAELRTVVAATMQPAHVSLWTRETST